MSGMLAAEPGADDAVLGTEWRDWYALLKPRVVTLVVFTGAVGLVIAPGHLNPVLGLAAILAIALGAGAAGALNMWYERDLDARMRRTRARPLPAGRVAPGDALAFGVGLSVFSVLLMALATNVAAALLLAVAILFYVVVYTVWLKRRTAQNIVIGGAAGAFPPLIGWAAVTGHVGLLPLFMFGAIFLWTPPHFWALALFACDDYAAAGVPMLPVVSGRRRTRREIFVYTLLLAAVAVAPWPLGLAGAAYGVVAAVLSAGFVAGAWRILTERQDADGRSLDGERAARATFRYSLAYLAVLFTALAVDRLAG